MKWITTLDSFLRISPWWKFKCDFQYTSELYVQNHDVQCMYVIVMPMIVLILSDGVVMRGIFFTSFERVFKSFPGLLFQEYYLSLSTGSKWCASIYNWLDFNPIPGRGRNPPPPSTFLYLGQKPLYLINRHHIFTCSNFK